MSPVKQTYISATLELYRRLPKSTISIVRSGSKEFNLRIRDLHPQNSFRRKCTKIRLTIKQTLKFKIQTIQIHIVKKTSAKKICGNLIGFVNLER